ncbi:hypothetical protein C2S53_018441 [Perilla frutescens var. hirtella]|uniref:Uncharacterized protein n=1 Tax=Perilla frutescens var. hirtella TaxID=608512 RepID=A0AAD4J914_PERFH|nr:hypothetical protein C2S53_018441 [Perilla frutescens var. hirtella]
MAAYAALLSLARTTDTDRNQCKHLFPTDAEGTVRSIHDYVNFLLLFFKEFPEKVKRWECKIRDVAYKTEDIIEIFIWQRIQSRHEARDPSRMIKLADQLGNVAEEIGLIAGEVMEERPDHLPAAAISSSLRLSSNGDDEAIGLHDDLLAIKERLCGQSSDLQVIPIVGMAGIGKTTLARAVYDDSLVVEHFEVRAWVTVSQDCRKFVLGLVESMNLAGEQMLGDEFDETEVALKVFKNLYGRRYLVVMDDVWSTEVWDEVRNMFPDEYNGSRIMLTTRLLDVAAYPDSNSTLHEMQFLNDYQSWTLLQKKVFTNSNCPAELEEVGKKIGRSCAGLPLAVVLVAGFLSAVNETRASWEEIAENVNTVVEMELEDILSLSYTHLPHHLRPCFLFIGGFPEDANIHASTLVKLWVAEGLLRHENGCCKSLEEEAEEYLEELVKRNLVIVTSRKSNGRIKSCSLHDMVRDMCIRKAGEEKFLRVMESRVVPPQGMMNERRISFNRSDVHSIWGPTIRTVLCFRLQSLPSCWPEFLQHSRLVRVLNAAGNHHNGLLLPSQLFELFHLTYLALVGSFKIPSAISNLVNLQTLIIRSAFPQRKRVWRDDKNASPNSLPLEIWRMRQLRHVAFCYPYILPHPPDGSNLPLENLQTLSPVQNLVWNEKILQMIPNVKRLRLVYTLNQECHLHHLNYLHQLENLGVTGCHIFSWKGKNPIFPRTLKKLSLVGGGFPWKDMAIVGSLPNLQVLKLLDYACDDHCGMWEIGDEEFPQLKFLLIDRSPLRQWKTRNSPFPRLECLVLRFCWSLIEIPESIGEIPTLELIEVDYRNKSLVDSAKHIKENQQTYGNYSLQVRLV